MSEKTVKVSLSATRTQSVWDCEVEVPAALWERYESATDCAKAEAEAELAEYVDEWDADGDEWELEDAELIKDEEEAENE